MFDLWLFIIYENKYLVDFRDEIECFIGEMYFFVKFGMLVCIMYVFVLEKLIW